MGFKNSKKSCIIFFNFFSFFMLCFVFSLKNVHALEIIDKGSTGFGNWAGGGSSCNSSTSWGCLTWYNKTDLKLAFRFTLVDKDGKRVAGTHSVDLTGDKGIFDRYFLLKYVDVFKDTNGYKFGYKYSDIYNDYEYSNNFKLIYDSSFPTRYTVKNGTFRNAITLYATKVDNVNNISCDAVNMCFTYKGYTNLYFIDWFFHVSGYLSDNDKTIYNNLSKLSKIRDGQYFLLVEPTLMAQYNHDGAHRYTYGTVTEFARDIMIGAHDQLSQNAKHIRTSAGCVLIQQPIESFSKITKASSTICNAVEGTDWKQANVRDIASDDYGYGMYLFSLVDTFQFNEVVPKETFELNLCSSSEDISSDGIVTFNTKSGRNIVDEKVLKTDLFKVGTGDENSSVYCFDNVTYDFSDVIKEFDGRRKKINAKIDVPSGNATVVRTCYVPTMTTYSIENVRSDLKNYENPGIKLNVYGDIYDFTTNVNDSSIGKRTIYGGSNYFIDQFTIEMKYNISDTISLGKKSSGVYEASISFGNVKTLFGQSNKLIENLLSDKSVHNLYPSDGAGFLMNPYNTEYSFECKFTTTVEKNSTDIQFRVISLDNPFPARDGTARLPGVNWLDEENYVYNYITKNRGVDTELIYDTEPMYSITLDAPTMINIRRYNSSHSYTDISLSCDEDNKQCTSDFLRNTKYISNLDGVCALSKDEFSKVGTNYQISDSAFINTVQNSISNNTYSSLYDANLDGKLTNDDLIIMLNQEKNTKFYTCGSKTYRSGGPVEENVGGIE